MTTRDDDLTVLSDTELSERTRKVHATLMQLPREHVNRDSYIIAFRLCINEVNRRKLPDPLDNSDTLGTRQPGASGFAPAPGGFYPTTPAC
jgi:hypothetical protein